MTLSSAQPPATARRKAFTIVELLVVVGIIAVLLGILIPVIRRSQQKAQAVACKAQLHDLGASFQMFLNYNKGHYPLAPSLPSVNPHHYETIMVQLAPYTNGRSRIFHCPADEEIYPVENTSYFYYEELGTAPLSSTFFYKVFKSASAVPVMWDAKNFHGGTVPYNWLFADGHVDEFLSAGH